MGKKTLYDERKRSSYMAAAGPDKSSERGQVWGNPMYDWDAMKEDVLMVEKANACMQRKLFDIVRIDHFGNCESIYGTRTDTDRAYPGNG